MSEDKPEDEGKDVSQLRKFTWELGDVHYLYIPEGEDVQEYTEKHEAEMIEAYKKAHNADGSSKS